MLLDGPSRWKYDKVRYSGAGFIGGASQDSKNRWVL